MKNDIFNFRRFGKYFASDIRTCWANFGLSLLTISLLFPISVALITGFFNLVLEGAWDSADMGIRFFVFCIAFVCLIVTMPVKCYGKITEKQYGSFWLTLPASKLEKFVSMFLMTCLIVPVIGIGLYLGVDTIICAIDSTCGNNLVAGGRELLVKMNELKEMTLNFVDETITVEDATAVHEILRQVSSPFLYVDEIFSVTLPFLLGALYFKSGKTVKTFLVLFAMGIASSILMTPVMENWTAQVMEGLNEDPTLVLNLIDNGVVKHLVIIDIISDTVVNLALMAGIWLRIKTLQH